MLQQTVLRLEGLSADSPVVICNDEHRFLVAEQLRSIDKLANNIILEPVGRNTAPAVALAAFTALASNENAEDPLLLILAADHVIRDESVFLASIRKAVSHAEADKLVTFGIVPTYPETGYGYIRRGSNVADDAFNVAEFVEKPGHELACSYLSSGEYYWNSGMFLFRASQYLAELRRYRPDIYHNCQQSVQQTHYDLDFVRIDQQSFSACPAESIDYAVMEQTEHAIVVPMDAGWSDVGSWSSLWDISEKDQSGNVVAGDVIQHDCSDTYVYAENSLVATVGLSNSIVIQTADAVLIADKTAVQDVKKIVEHLKNHSRKEYRAHKDLYRPWGQVTTLAAASGYIVNKLIIQPGKQMKSQIHHHRAEHWIVVSGTAKVQMADETYLVAENESTFISSGMQHTLSNPGDIPLEIIEIQTGQHLNEDDVVRVDSMPDEAGKRNE